MTSKNVAHCEKPVTLTPFSIAADTHVGLVREENEDSFSYAINSNIACTFVAVADGIGGHDGGEIASRLCMEKMLTAWRERSNEQTINPAHFALFLEEEISHANDLIHSLNEQNHVQHPMGTTVVSAVFTPCEIVVAHVGDSRCYRVRNSKVEQITEDHSFVAELLRKNVITPEEAIHHPFAHIISRSVGPVATVDVEINCYDTLPGDRYIFCSDGLTNHVSDIEIGITVEAASNPYEASKNLIRAALQGGGEDNVTVLSVFL